jgi:hypothetical protein
MAAPRCPDNGGQVSVAVDHRGRQRGVGLGECLDGAFQRLLAALGHVAHLLLERRQVLVKRGRASTGGGGTGESSGRSAGGEGVMT